MSVFNLAQKRSFPPLHCVHGVVDDNPRPRIGRRGKKLFCFASKCGFKKIHKGLHFERWVKGDP
jgi:hypothetical protein